jgi:predicted nucleic acid-binding protein
MAAAIAVDTSVAVAYVVRSHTHHALVRRQLNGFRLHLTAHSLAETYSVLTRLPGDARLTAEDASTVIEANFPEVVMMTSETARRLHVVLAAHGISGGAVYDALVALAVKESGLHLATRDSRAAATYAALSVRVKTIAE